VAPCPVNDMHRIDDELDDILGSLLHDAVVEHIHVANLTGQIDIDLGLHLGTPSTPPGGANVRLRFTGVHSFAYELPPCENGRCGTMGIGTVRSSEAAFRLQTTYDNFGLTHYHIEMLGRPGSLLREEYRSGIHIIAESCEAYYI
jgi:hypothetical protein